MVYCVFYCDEKIMQLERDNCWYDEVEYLSKLYEENQIAPVAEDILCSLIFVCWYAYSKLENTPARYVMFQDFDYFKKQWLHFVCVGLDKFYNSHSLNFVIGYTAYTDNKYYKPMKRFGEDLMKKACVNMPLELPYDVMLGKVRKNKNDDYLIIPDILFPGRCVADNYFREILAQAGIE